MKIRAFIAVDIGPLSELVKFEEEIKATGAKVKLVEPDNIHITLKFLGDTSDELVPDINDIIQNSVNNIKPFQLQLHGSGAFPNLNYIKIIWIGINDPGPLPKLARELDNKLIDLGFKPESRGFKPHITLGRVKGSQNKSALKKLISENKDRNFGELEIKEIKLKQSVLDPTGPTYFTLGDITLD